MKYFATIFLGLFWIVSQAQTPAYPVKPIEFIVPFGTGGASDILARAIAKSMSNSLGQPLVVVNVTGAGGSIGLSQVSKAKPDGYTIGMGTVSALVISPQCVKNAPYNSVTDFTPVSRFAASPIVLAVPKNSSLKTFQELVSTARQNPNKVNYGAQYCNHTHLIMETIAFKTNTKLTMIPYKAANQMLLDFLRGDLNSMAEIIMPVNQHIAAGSAVPLAVAWPNRLAELPNVPTFTELELPEANIVPWYGIIAPANTPAYVIDRLRNAMRVAAKDPEFLNILAKNMAYPLPITESAEFLKIISDSIRSSRKVMESSNFSEQQ